MVWPWKRKTPRLTKTVWRTHHKVLREYLDSVLKNDDLAKRFDDVTIGGLLESFHQAERADNKLTVFNASITVLLALSLVKSGMDAKIWIFSADQIRNLKEAVLFVAATSGLISSQIQLRKKSLGVILDAWNRYKYPEQIQKLT